MEWREWMRFGWELYTWKLIFWDGWITLAHGGDSVFNAVSAICIKKHPILTVRSKSNRMAVEECLKWLDGLAPRSAIYVSFGTTTSLTEEEAAEIAAGLELSNQKFLWVLRDADKADIFTGRSRRIELPEGFEERVAGRGMVVRGWAPQVEILAHESTGGFMTHCGWNSCLESVAAGVPVAAWPMHTDQGLNAVFLTEVLKVGVAVRDWRRREELVTAEVVRSAVERLMTSEEGSVVRRRSSELGGAVRKSGGGRRGGVDGDGKVC